MGLDILIGDPLFTCPIYNPGGEDMNMCYEVHGDSDEVFNLISDTCVSVNAHYVPVLDLNIIGAIGVTAEGSNGECWNIQVDLDQCAVSAGKDGNLAELDGGKFSAGGVYVRKTRTDRVRISVPNCDSVKLVMWVICEQRNNIDMIRFEIARGLNLAPTSHGLLGESGREGGREGRGGEGRGGEGRGGEGRGGEGRGGEGRGEGGGEGREGKDCNEKELGRDMGRWRS